MGIAIYVVIIFPPIPNSSSNNNPVTLADPMANTATATSSDAKPGWRRRLEMEHQVLIAIKLQYTPNLVNDTTGLFIRSATRKC